MSEDKGISFVDNSDPDPDSIQDNPLNAFGDGEDFMSDVIPNSIAAEWLQGFADALDPEKASDVVGWSPQPGPQEEAFYHDADELFFGGAAGGGKAIVYGSKALTPFGWKLVDDIKVGDALIAVDGTHTNVLAVYPHQDKDLYKFTFADGATLTVTDDHVWMYWYAGKRIKAERKYVLYSPEKGVHTENVRGKLGLSKDLYEWHRQEEQRVADGKRPRWILMPLCEPVKFTKPASRHDAPHKIDPYLMGILIAEGSLNGTSSFAITSGDPEIMQWVEDALPYGDSFGFIREMTRGISGGETKARLEHFGLYPSTSDTKFIPDVYKYTTVEDRFSLMQGLMDGDGYVDNRGHCSYTTVSKQLAEDVQFLARSLGAKATITDKQGGYKSPETGEHIETKRVYNVWMQGAHLDKFVRLPRKKERLKPYNGGVSTPSRRVVNIEKVGMGDGVCFAIDHPTGLHVVQDFVVTHNSDLMLGLALSELSPHRKAIVFRRSYPELKDIVTRAQEIVANTGARFKAGNQMRFDGLPHNKSLELGSVPNFQAAQKYRGRPHDLKLFDEVADMPESIYAFLIGWARTTEKGVPVRVVAAGNPPTTTEGQWVVRRWAPWLDPNHPDPANPGEKRWFATLDGEDREITDLISPEGAKGNPFEWTDKQGNTETVYPKSRTFIPAKLSDNKYLAESGYRTVLQGMPEPYRSQLLYGDFNLSVKEDPWQVIPTEWVLLAERRWQEAKDAGEIDKLTKTNPSFGLDVAEAGADKTVLVKLTGTYVQYYDFIEVEEDDIMLQVDLIETKLAGSRRAPIAVDAIGVGVGVASVLKRRGYKVVPIKVSRATKRRDKTGVFRFLNVRAEIWWRMREALDPYNDHPLAIPPDPRLRAELTSAKYERTPNDKLKIEEKARIRDRLGRSPDIAEALMLALYVQKRGAVPLRMV